MKLTLSFICVVLLFGVISTNIFAQGKGEMTGYDITSYGCELDKVIVKWSFSTLMGESVTNGTFSWEAGYGTDDDCLSYKTFLLLKVRANGNSQNFAWVRFDPDIPDAGDGFGYNTPGSGDWDELFCGYTPSGVAKNCMTTSEAKAFWKAGFKVVDFRIRKRD